MATRTSVALGLNLTTQGGNVYCAALPPSASVKTVLDIRQSAVRTVVPAGQSSATLLLTGLNPATTYKVLCYTDDFASQVMTLEDTLQTAVTITTACCRSLILGNVPNNIVQYFTTSVRAENYYTVGLDSTPTARVDVILSIEQVKCAANSPALSPSDVAVLPSTFAFTPTSASLQGTFVIRTSVIGCYVLTARASGIDSYAPENTTVAVWSFRSPPVVPALSSVYLSNRGTSLLLTFSSATDRGADKLVNFAAAFNCANLVDFVGANVATCKWLDSSTVEASFVGSLLKPSVGENATLLGGIVKAVCVDMTPCGSYQYVQKTERKIGSPPAPLALTPIILTLSAVALCDDISLDPTPSRGAAGRDWDNIDWSVKSIGIARNAADIEKLLNTQYASTAVVAVIPNKYLTPSTQYAQSGYEFTLSLTNFLGQRAVVRVPVLVGNGIGATLPQIRLFGTGTTLYRWKPLTLSAIASFPTCVQDTSKLPLFYSWKVYDGLIFLPDVKSTATDQKIFRLPAYTLEASKIYTISVDVSFSPGGVAAKSLGFASGKIIVGESGVAAQIAGGSLRTVNTDDVVSLDASGSSDIDYPTQSAALTFQWSCTQFLPVFGAPCPDFPNSTSALLSLPAGSLVPALTYNLSVVVTNGARRSDTAFVLVQVSQSPIPAILLSPPSDTRAKYNIEDKLILSAQINSPVGKSTAQWLTSSIHSFATSGVNLSPISKTFPQGVSMFQLSLAAGLLTPGLSYTFQLQCGYTGSASQAVSEVTVRMNEAPSGGSLRVVPTTGTALSTVYDIRSANWIDDESDFPLSYLISYYLLDPTKLNLLKRLDTIPFIASTLGQGLSSLNYEVSCLVAVQDIYGGRANSTATTVVRPAASTADVVTTTNAALTTAVSNLDATSIVTAVNAALNSINSVVCTVPTPCVQLNRQQCQSSQRTCGPCLAGFGGAPGDANSHCYDANQLKRIGAPCSAHSTCATGSCVKGACADVAKSCVDDCSGSGRCVFVDSLGAAMPTCSITDPSCSAKCICASDRYGSTCALRQNAFQQQVSLRTTLCSAIYKSLELQDVSADVIQSRALSISNVLVDIEQINTDALGNCTAALVTTVLDYPTLSCAGEGMTLVGDALSRILDRGKDLPPALLSSVLTAISALTTGCLEDVVLGESPRTIENTNMRLLTTVLDASTIADTVFHPPQSPIERLNDNPKAALTIDTFAAGDVSDTLGLSIVVFKNNPRGVKTNATRMAMDFKKNPVSASTREIGLIAQRQLQQTSSELDVGFTMVLQNVEPVIYDATAASHLTFRCFRPFQDEPYQLNGTCPTGQQLTLECPSRTKRTYNVSCPARITFPSCTLFDGVGYAVSPDCRVVAFTPHNTTCFCSSSVNTATATESSRNRRSLQASTGLQEYSTVESAFATEYIEVITNAPFLTEVKQNAAILSTLGAFILVYLAGIIGCFLWEQRNRALLAGKSAATKKYADPVAAGVATATAKKKVRTANNFFDSLFPDEFRSAAWYHRLWNQIQLEHLLLRPLAPCTYTAESVEHWTVACGAVLVLIFVNSVVAKLIYADDGHCETIIDQEACEGSTTLGAFIKPCHWIVENEACEFQQPSASFYHVILLTLIAAVFTAPLDCLWNFCIRNVSEFARHRRLQIAVAVEEIIAPWASTSPTASGPSAPPSSLRLRAKNDEFSHAITLRSKIMRAARLVCIQSAADNRTPIEEAREIDRRLAEEQLKATFRTFHDVASTTDLSRIRYGLSRASYAAIERKVVRARAEAENLRRELSAIDDPELREEYLMKHFIVHIYSGYQRSVVHRYFFPTDYTDPTRSTSLHVAMQHGLCLLLLPVLFFVMLYYIFAFNANIGSRAGNLWLLVTFVSLLQKTFFAEPCKILVKWMVLNASVATDVRKFCEALSQRSLVMLRRTNGVVRNYNDMVQHFNPACRAARTYSSLPIARLLLSINDCDINMAPRAPNMLLRVVNFFGATALSVAALPDPLLEVSLEYLAVALIDFAFIALFFAHTVSPVLVAFLVIFIVAVCLYPCRTELALLCKWCLSGVRTKLAIQPAPHFFDFEDEASFAPPPQPTKKLRSRQEQQRLNPSSNDTGISTRVSTFSEIVSMRLASGQLRVVKRRAYPFRKFSTLYEMNRKFGITTLLDKDVALLSSVADAEDENEGKEEGREKIDFIGHPEQQGGELRGFSPKRLYQLSNEEKSSPSGDISQMPSKLSLHTLDAIPEDRNFAPQIGFNDDCDVQSVLSADSPTQFAPQGQYRAPSAPIYGENAVAHQPTQSWATVPATESKNGDGDNSDWDGGASVDASSWRSHASSSSINRRSEQGSRHNQRKRTFGVPQDALVSRMRVAIAPGASASLAGSPAHSMAGGHVPVTSGFLTIPHTPEGRANSAPMPSFFAPQEVSDDVSQMSAASSRQSTVRTRTAPSSATSAGHGRHHAPATPFRYRRGTAQRASRYTDVAAASPGGASAAVSIEEIKQHQTGVASPTTPHKQNHTPAYFPRKLARRKRHQQHQQHHHKPEGSVNQPLGISHSSSSSSSFAGPGRILVAHEMNELPSFPLMY